MRRAEARASSTDASQHTNISSYPELHSTTILSRPLRHKNLCVCIAPTLASRLAGFVPTYAPWNSTGTVTSTDMMGSSTTGSALLYACEKAYIAASLNAISFESTACA
jgi:hypothetical protein